MGLLARRVPNAAAARATAIPAAAPWTRRRCDAATWSSPELLVRLRRAARATSHSSPEYGVRGRERCGSTASARQRSRARIPELLASPRAMQLACESDNAAAVALLLDLGVPVNIPDREGRRAAPLHVAAYSDAPNACRDADRARRRRGRARDALRRHAAGLRDLGGSHGGDRGARARTAAPCSASSFAGRAARLREVLAEDPRARRHSRRAASRR